MTALRPPVALLLLLAAACGGPDAAEEEIAPAQDEGPAAPRSDELMSSIDFRIDRGDHYSHPDRLASLHMGTKVDRTLSFKVRFDSKTIAYTTADPQNQGDWCKVMGISTNRIHHNSIRIGWRWVPAAKKVELGFYGYIEGTRISQPLARVDPDVWATASVRMWNGGLAATVNGATYRMDRSLGFSKWLPTSTWVLETTYFGGDEAAPHDVHLSVGNISVN